MNNISPNLSCVLLSQWFPVRAARVIEFQSHFNPHTHIHIHGNSHGNLHTNSNSGVFRGAMVRCPPFGPTMKIFYRRLYMKRCVFCRFPANFRKKWANLWLPMNVQKQSVSASGGLCPPDLLTRGSAPGPCWGQSLQTPVIGSRYRARHGAVPPDIGG